MNIKKIEEILDLILAMTNEYFIIKKMCDEQLEYIGKLEDQLIKFKLHADFKFVEMDEAYVVVKKERDSGEEPEEDLQVE